MIHINATIYVMKNLQHNFPKIRGGVVEGCLEVFQKFIQNGTVKRPLIPLHTRNGQTNGHVKVQPKCAEAVTAKFIFEVLGATAFRKYRFLGSPGKNR